MKITRRHLRRLIRETIEKDRMLKEELMDLKDSWPRFAHGFIDWMAQQPDMEHVTGPVVSAWKERVERLERKPMANAQLAATVRDMLETGQLEAIWNRIENKVNAVHQIFDTIESRMEYM
jgi:hypothetical protein